MSATGLRVRPPVALVLPIIDVCGGRCTMCGIWQRPPRPPLEPGRLAQVLADPLLSGSLTHVNVTGGEPVDHPAFPEIASTLSAGLPSLVQVNVNTSGLAAERTVAGVEAFRRSLDPRVEMMATVSLDGIGKLHDRIRGVKGAFEETSRAVEGCVEVSQRLPGLEVHLNCTISHANLDGVGEVLAWARARGIGLTLTAAASNDLYLGNVRYRARFGLTGRQREELARLLDGLRDDDVIPRTERHYYEMVAGMLRGGDRSCDCVYQSHGVFLDLDGLVYPCGTAGELPYGRLPEESFEEVYLGPKGDEVRRALMRGYCPSCPTNSYHGLADGVWLEVLRKGRAKRWVS